MEFSNLVEMFDRTADSFPKKIGIVFGSKAITYKSLKEITQKLANSLYKLGLKDKDKVCLWLPNCPEFIYSYFAILRLGCIVVPINSMFRREEAKFVVENSGAKILICSIDKIEASEIILARVDSLKYLVCVPRCDKDNVINFRSLIEETPLREAFHIDSDSIAEILYTSGTTGKPKGACLTHRNLLANVKDSSLAIKVTSRDCFLCILPLFHSFASTVCMLLPICKGAKIVVMRTIRPFKRVIRTVFRKRVTVFAAVPSLYKILADSKFPRHRLFLARFFNPIRLCISGAAALSKETLRKFEAKFRRPLLEGYGLTEASPVVSLNPLERKIFKWVKKSKDGSVGIAFPSLKIKVIDKEGKALSMGKVGELIVKGPSIMKGYYHLEEETKKVLRDGWLHTGDLVRVDQDGYIYIMGRDKDMINVRGLNVYPKEIEELLYKHPNVKEAAVVGVNHRHRGEVPLAFVVKGAVLTERQLIDYLRSNLASYKVPLKVIFKDSLPKNTTGKILKRELRKEVRDIFK